MQYDFPSESQFFRARQKFPRLRSVRFSMTRTAYENEKTIRFLIAFTPSTRHAEIFFYRIDEEVRQKSSFRWVFRVLPDIESRYPVFARGPNERLGPVSVL